MVAACRLTSGKIRAAAMPTSGPIRSDEDTGTNAPKNGTVRWVLGAHGGPAQTAERPRALADEANRAMKERSRESA